MIGPSFSSAGFTWLSSPAPTLLPIQHLAAFGTMLGGGERGPIGCCALPALSLC